MSLFDKDSAKAERQKEMMNQPAAAPLEWQGKFSHKTSDGSSVYVLPKDRMPCLVADKTVLEKMSTGSNRITMNSEQMPNAFPKAQVIPHLGINH